MATSNVGLEVDCSAENRRRNEESEDKGLGNGGETHDISINKYLKKIDWPAAKVIVTTLLKESN